MLSKSKRLNLKKDFKWVANGNKEETNSFKIFFRTGDNNKPLVGIATSKQYFKEAHDRNRARRISSKSVEEIYPNLPNNLNLVIMPKGNIFNKQTKELVYELSSIKYPNTTN